MTATSSAARASGGFGAGDGASDSHDQIEGAEQLRQQGNAAFKRSEFRSAEALYSEALLAGGSGSASEHLILGNRAAALLRLGLAEKALESAVAAVTLEPEWDKGWRRKGLALQQLGLKDEAAAALERAAELCGPAAAKRRGAVSSGAGGASPGGGSSTCSVGEASAAAVTAALGGDRTLRVAPAGGRPEAAEVQAALPPHALFRSSHDGSSENLLILLHGLGDTPVPFAKLAAQMALPQTATLALPSVLPVAGTNGGRAWFEAFDEHGEVLAADATGPAAERRLDSFASALRYLQNIVDRLAGDRPNAPAAVGGAGGGGGIGVVGGGTSAAGGTGRAWWPRNRIHLFGFSQGGTAALHLAARHTGKRALGSCAAVSASLLLPAANASSSPLHLAPGKAPAGTPVLITHGASDDVVPRADVDATAALLNRRWPGSAEVATFDKGHGMISGRPEMLALMRFWGDHLGAAPPPTANGEEMVELTTRQ